jgi:hypothetical protein
MARRYLVAVSDPHADDQGLVGPDLAHMGVRRGRAVQVQNVIEHAHGTARLCLAALAIRGARAQPFVGGAAIVERLGVDHARAGGRHRRGRGLRRACSPPTQPATLLGAQGRQHEHVLDLAGVPADDVATVLRAERPRELQLDEAEQATPRRYSPTWARLARLGTLIAYFDGLIGTVGFSILPRRLISLRH